MDCDLNIVNYPDSFITSAIPGGNRKRAFSNPHIGIIGGVGGGLGAGGLSVDPGAFMHRLNPQLYYYNKSQSGRSSFCVDESLWPTNPNHNARASDTNLYMGSSTDEDYEEAIDQFSPTLYTRTGASRAIPIPTSAGNSPQHQLHPHLNPHPGRIATGINSAAAAAAFSASPSIYAYPHSPFYASSPETSSLSSSAQMSGMPTGHPGPSSRISFSYDPAFQRLQVPKTRSPLECASVLAAVAAAATCGDAQQMGLATPCN
ncbi:protein bunched, class 2/F/G isoform-like, partial [Drosophila serrata]|uniref:protein bunched, class 2/F/G isoform-like n=1 Tax=Drosophila serrata TaxID=7274 RepID=UPI000A1D13DB